MTDEMRERMRKQQAALKQEHAEKLRQQQQQQRQDVSNDTLFGGGGGLFDSVQKPQQPAHVQAPVPQQPQQPVMPPNQQQVQPRQVRQHVQQQQASVVQPDMKQRESQQVVQPQTGHVSGQPRQQVSEPNSHIADVQEPVAKPEPKQVPIVASKPKQDVVKKPDTATYQVDYLQYEAEKGVGFGIKGLGRMVHFTNDGQYVLRDKQSEPRVPAKLANGRKNLDYADDIYDDTRVRVPIPLLDAVTEYWHQELGLPPSQRIASTDLIVFLLFLQLPHQHERDILEPLLGERYKRFAPLMSAYLENLTIDSTEATLNAMTQKVDMVESKMNAMLSSMRHLDESHNQTDAYILSIARGMAYQIAYTWGIDGGNFPKTTDDGEALLNSDNIIRMMNMMHAVGDDELSRQQTIRQSAKRRNSK